MPTEFYKSTTTTGGESFSKTYPEKKNITVEFYQNGTPVKVSGLQSNEDVAVLLGFLKTIDYKQWEVTW